MESYYRRKEKRESQLRKAGFTQNEIKELDPKKRLFMCTAHEYETSRTRKQVVIEGKQKTLTFKKYMPTGQGLSVCMKVLSTRKSWPTFVLFEEDHKLKNQKWEKYKDQRVIMWDNTDVPFNFKPSSAEDQRATFSKYYNGNCAKGGVFIQLCGWLGTSCLWTGHISDSDYMEKTGVLREQDKFAEKDVVNGNKVSFLNIFDRGYRLLLIAWQLGKQLVSQPIFSKADGKFTGRAVKQTASVAADRSGNERAVNVCCRIGYVTKGLEANGNPERLDNVWLGWSFQANFMYQPVH